MASPKFVRGDYADLHGSTQLPVLEELFFSELARHPMRRVDLFSTRTNDRDIYQSTELHDLPLFTEVSEGENYIYDQPNQGFDKTFTPVKFGRGFSISEEAVADGKFNYIADMVKKLAKSARETQEIASMNVFNNGFTSETTPDGQPLFDAAHLIPSAAATFANEPGTGSDLTIGSLETEIASFRKEFIGDTQIIQHIVPKILLVPEELRHTAIQLLESEKRPQTADNNINSVSRDGIRVISSPHLTDSDAWFLLADKQDHGLRIIERMALNTQAAGKDLGFNNDSIFYKARYREALGAIRATGVHGNPGI